MNRRLKSMSATCAAVVLIATMSVGIRDASSAGVPTWLITDGEAMMPSPAVPRSAPVALPQTGPLIRIERPERAGLPLAAPFPLDVRFDPRPGHAPVKMDTLQIVYLKIIELDVTERFRPHIKDNRLFVEKAAIPSGRHRLRISIADTEGNVTVEILQATVK